MSRSSYNSRRMSISLTFKRRSLRRRIIWVATMPEPRMRVLFRSKSRFSKTDSIRLIRSSMRPSL
jgi:hypothetical protein